MKKTFQYCLILLFIYSCSHDNDVDYSFPFDHLNSKQSGISFANNLNDTDSFNIMQYLYYYNGGGVAAGDLNNDGLVDLYFTGNQVNDALYFNEGNLKFKDVSESSGINKNNGWSTGVTMLDINKDGWLDIYVCRLGKYKIYNDHNKLYINNQDGTFTESSKKYGLAFSGFSTQAAFFDFDKDGDLDCYLLNHSVKRPDQFVQANRIRNELDSLAGDRLFKNEKGHFIDITASSGIYSSSVGFGLSVCIADLNNDFWPDIYIGNDFHENDYLYLNQKDGTFKEVIDKAAGHTSNFTMGSTISDFNDDGELDIFSLDMLPKKEAIFKQSGGWESKQIYDFKRAYGYHDQSPKNALQIKISQEWDLPIYSEQASLYNLQASDWSWSPLIKDFDLDNDKDVYITNGILKRPNDMDFVNYFSDPSNGNKTDLEMIDKMPSGLISNQYFTQENDQFIESYTGEPTISNGACTADLDNDGDLDIIVNNLNANASLLINSTNPSNYLKIKLEGDSLHTMAKAGILIYASNSNHTSTSLISGNKGFQSMDEEIAILPHSKDTLTLTVHYPDGFIGEYIIDPEANEFNLVDSLLNSRERRREFYNHHHSDTLYQHIENGYNDQNKEALLLYNASQLGPKIAYNGNEHIYVTQAKGTNGSIIDLKSKNIVQTINKGGITQFVDETDAVFFDADGDGDDDLYICLGGNELLDGDLSLSDVLFLNENGSYVINKNMLPFIPKNTSTVSAADYDNDGDIDLFIGVQGRAGDYGNPDVSYLLKNENNQNFKAFILDVKEMVYDSEWKDIDHDGRQDLIIVGHWMPITILYNRKEGFEKFEIPNSKGWWNTVEIADFDHDDKLDIMAGNFGQNHRLKVSPDTPLKMYVGDFDQNGKNDPIITYQIDGIEYPYANLDLLLKQIPGKRKQFILHNVYATKSITEIFSPKELSESKIKFTQTLSSSVFFQNTYKEWDAKTLPLSLQLAPIWAIEVHKDKYILGGNLLDVDPNLGRQDALPLSMMQFNAREIVPIKSNYLSQNLSEVRSLLSYGSNLIIGVNDGYIVEQNIQK